MMEEAPYQKPFSMDYVVRTTLKHMRKSVDTSIRKTLERIPEFAGDEPKSRELFLTLAYLHQMKRNLNGDENAKYNHQQEG